MKNKTRRSEKNKCPIFLLTVSTKTHPDLERYKKSAETHGFKPHIYGLHEKRSVGHTNGAFGVKLNYLQKAVNTLDPETIVLSTDAWDVIIVGDCSEVLKKYKSFKKDIVLSAEKFCWPDWHNFYKFNFYNSPFPYINAGGVIGKAGTIKKLLDKYYNGEDAIDDQRLWTKMYLENRSKFALDENAEIFLNTCWVKKEKITYKDNKLYYEETETYPSIIHINGSNKSYEDMIKY